MSTTTVAVLFAGGQHEKEQEYWRRDPEVMAKCRFQVTAILKSNMADIKGEFQVAQYLKMFATYYCTFVPNLVLVSQNAQLFL